MNSQYTYCELLAHCDTINKLQSIMSRAQVIHTHTHTIFALFCLFVCFAHSLHQYLMLVRVPNHHSTITILTMTFQLYIENCVDWCILSVDLTLCRSCLFITNWWKRQWSHAVNRIPTFWSIEFDSRLICLFIRRYKVKIFAFFLFEMTWFHFPKHFLYLLRSNS